mgnify:CR=1 FL=1
MELPSSVSEIVPAIDPATRTVVVTDPGTPLASSGAAAVFESPADVGGRFSALSPFGLVPLFLAGRDVAGLAGAVVPYAVVVPYST